MKTETFFLGLAFFFLNITSCTTTRSENPFPETVFYQIYIRAFCDSDGDGIGDINGVTSKLDYLEDLGIGALWLMPLFEAPTVHKYFSSDHEKVDPEYGTSEDLKRLVEEAHKRGIKVMIDFSINHASSFHPWFLETLEEQHWLKGSRIPEETSQYRDYFHWVENLEDYNPEVLKPDGSLDKRFFKNYNKAKDKDSTSTGWYYARFLDAPDFNFDNPKVREYMFQVGRYWLEEIGVDGFRLDAARHIYDIESTHPVSEKDRNFIWWKEFTSEMQKHDPDAFFLGEIWSNAEVMGSYLNTGMHALFNFDFSADIINAVNRENNPGLTEGLLNQHDYYGSNREDFGDGTFLVNHDMPRLLDSLKFDLDKVRLSTSILLTYPGSPFIYYGEELGYHADRWLVWLPMLWDENDRDPGQTEWMFDPEISKTLISPPPPDAMLGIKPVTVQKINPESLYHHYRSLIRLRMGSKPLREGGLESSELSDEKIIAFYRSDSNTALLVLHNLTDELQQVPMDKGSRRFLDTFYSSHKGGKVVDGFFVLPPFSTLILNK